MSCVAPEDKDTDLPSSFLHPSNWSTDTFHDAVAFHTRAPAAAGRFFADYGFEVLDRVVDHAVSVPVPAGTPLEASLFATVGLVAAHARPREVFLMVTEKAATVAASGGGGGGGPCLLPLLLYGVQCAAVKVLAPLPPHQDAALFGLLLALALRLVAAGAGDDGASLGLAAAMAAVDHALHLANGVLARSTAWAAATPADDATPSALDTATGHALVGFLLRVAVLGAGGCTDPTRRRRCVLTVAACIARCGSGSALAAVVAAPRRVRCFMLRARWCLLQPEVARRQRHDGVAAAAAAVAPSSSSSSSSSSLGARAVEVSLDRCIDAEWRAAVVGLVDRAVAEEDELGAACSVDELVSWEQVTDDAALRFVKELRAAACDGDDGDDVDGDDEGGDVGAGWTGAAATPHERGARTLAGLRAQRAWQVLGPGPGPGPGAAPAAGAEEVACWSVTGAALVTHALLSLSNIVVDGDGDSGDDGAPELVAHAKALFPRGVVCPRALWAAAYPHVFALLRCVPVAACEGLGLAAIVLGTLLPRAGGARVEYAPPSLLSVTGSAAAVGGEHRAPELLNDDEGFAYDPRSVGRVLLAVDAGTGPTCARALRLGVAAARSADALLLAQVTVNAMVACADEGLRRRAFNGAFRGGLLAHVAAPWGAAAPVPVHGAAAPTDPAAGARLCLLKQLSRNCPFPQVAGLLVDCVKSFSQQGATGARLLPGPASEGAAGPAAARAGGSAEEPSAADALFWPGPSPFFSVLALRWFVAATLRKVPALSAQKLLDSADEVGAAANLLQFVALRVRACLAEATAGTVASRATAARQLRAFLGEGETAAETETETEAAVVAARQVFAGGLGLAAAVRDAAAAVEGAAERRRRKQQQQRPEGSDQQQQLLLQTLKRKLVDTEAPAAGAEGAEHGGAADLLCLDVLLDNLRHLRDLLDTIVGGGDGAT